MENRLASLRRLLRIYGNWLTVKLIGKDLVSKEDLAELKKYGKLPLGDEVDLIGRAFSLGRADSLSKKSEYKELTLEKLSTINKFRHTSEDSLAVREAKLHAARHLQSAVDSAAEGAFVRLNDATQDMLSDAVVKEIIKDEVAMALKEKKTRDQLASSLANKLDKTLTRDIKKIAVTEMHRAKQRGAAMAIANRVGVYAKSDGPNSMVSVVPNSGACDDCKNLYLDKDGNPKVFKLSTLVARGSNADAGVSHKVGPGGLRTGWKAVMPPAHPSCYCELIYLPPGMSWINGRLKVTDELRYKDSISKAVDKGSMSPTITPPGPKSTQGPKVANPGSISGLPAPGNVPGPGAPKSNAPTLPAPAPSSNDAATTPAPQAADQNSGEAPSGQPWEYWGSRSGTPDPAQGWEQAPKSGAWRIDPALLGGGAGGAEGGEQEEYELDPSFANARNWRADQHSPEVLRQHLTEGKVILSENLKTREKSGGDAEPGINTSYEEVISGNGSMLTKPGSDTAGSDVNREVAAYELMTSMGIDRCPMTVSRNRNGAHASCMHWLKTHRNAMKAVEELQQGDSPIDTPGKQYKAMMEKSADPKKLREQLENIAVMDMVMNNRDRHVNNFMVNEDFTDARAIDHGFCFTSGLIAYKGHIHAGFNSNRMDVKINPELQERFETTSFGDMKRSFGKNLADWQTAQTYLRMKYVLHVASENDGKLPYAEFNEDPETQDAGLRETPNEKFEDFALDFIDKNSADPSSPEYATAQMFEEIGIFATFEHSAASEAGMSVAPLGRYRQERIIRQHRANVASPGWMAAAREKYAIEATRSAQDKVVDAMDVEEAAQDAHKEATTLLDKYEDSTSKNREVPFNEDKKWLDLVAAKKKARKDLEVAQQDLRDAEAEEERALLGARSDFEIVPPGQEDIFNRLNQRIALAESGKLPARAKRRSVSKMERVVTNMAANIERDKRKEDLEGLGWANRNKERA